MRRWLFLVLLAALCLPACAGETFQLRSPAFAEGGSIPARFTCSGEDLSPPLEWSGVPAKARSLALIVHDPDAPGGDFVHWMAIGLPADSRSLKEGVADREPSLAQGLNDFEKTGYGGPCPPPGKPHRYIFELVALSQVPSLAQGFARKEFEEVVARSEVGRATLKGTFKR